MIELPRLVMMGTGTFARPTFEAILAAPNVQVVGLVTQPDRDGGSHRGSTRQTGESLKSLAVARGIPVYQPQSINTPEGVEQLKAWQPDLLVVAAYGQILKSEVLEAARWGGINVHGSLLPKYRGAAPVAHAILNGETTTGVTIIRMTTGLDAGDMLAQDSLEIGSDETAGEVEARLAPLGAHLAIGVIEKLRQGDGLIDGGIKQDQALVTKAPKLKKEDGLIDWSQPAERVRRQIRAMQPWPTAYTFLHHANKPPLRLIITKTGEPPAQPSEPPAHSSEPPAQLSEPPASAGGVVVTNNHLFAFTGDQQIEIIELQPAGKKHMTAADFLRGHTIQPGDRFGSETE